MSFLELCNPSDFEHFSFLAMNVLIISIMYVIEYKIFHYKISSRYIKSRAAVWGSTQFVWAMLTSIYEKEKVIKGGWNTVKRCGRAINRPIWATQFSRTIKLYKVYKNQ